MYHNDFVDYCFEFYGYNGLYAETFDGQEPVTRAEIAAACVLYDQTRSPGPLDSHDRECIREILLFVRDKQELNRRAIG